jgi:secretion/DNA translocation related TadE-like protein
VTTAVRRRPAGEAGTATPLVLGLAAVLIGCGAVATALGAVAVARQQAASAADLSALAAAAVVLHGPDAACARARALAADLGARITSCRVEGDRVDLVAQVRPPGPLGRLGAASVRAAAGPVADG